MYHKFFGNVLKYDYEASVCDSDADLAQEDAYDQNEGEACTYLRHKAYDGNLLPKMGHKRRNT